MVAGSFSVEVPASVSCERLWKAAVCDSHVLLPKLIPDIFTGCDLQGDGGAGSIKTFKFETPAVPLFDYTKDEIEVMDHSSHTLKAKVIEGGLIGLKLKSESVLSKIEVTGADSCVVKFKIEYETLDEKPFPEEDAAIIKNGMVSVTKKIEEHLIANPTAYA